MPLNRENLRHYLEEQLSVDVDAIEDDQSLFSSGILDSFSMLDLLMYIEEAIAQRIPPGDVSMDNFDSIARILKFTATLNDD